MNDYPQQQVNVLQGRESEVTRELNRLRISSQEIQKLSSELTQRLASVLSVKDAGETTKLEQMPAPNSPLASNLSDIAETFNGVEKTLRFILAGLEL